MKNLKRISQSLLIGIFFLSLTSSAQSAGSPNKNIHERVFDKTCSHDFFVNHIVQEAEKKASKSNYFLQDFTADMKAISRHDSVISFNRSGGTFGFTINKLRSLVYYPDYDQSWLAKFIPQRVSAWKGFLVWGSLLLTLILMGKWTQIKVKIQRVEFQLVRFEDKMVDPLIVTWFAILMRIFGLLTRPDEPPEGVPLLITSYLNP